MKKVLTILAILVVLTSAIFAAAETHKITITAHVEGADPIFQLKAGDITTNGTKVSFDEDAAAYLASGEIDKKAIDITTAPITGSVTASIVGDLVKLAAETTYTLTFKASPLESKENKATNTHKILPVAEQNATGIARATGIDSHITMDATATVAVNSAGVLTGSIEAVMSVDNIGKCDLATFTFKYAADPAAPADDYEGTISLEITAG